jgi:hypothetical protein
VYIIIKTKDTDNIIGLKEDIAMRLEGVVGIERIDVREEGDGWLNAGCLQKP